MMYNSISNGGKMNTILKINRIITI